MAKRIRIKKGTMQSSFPEWYKEIESLGDPLSGIGDRIDFERIRPYKGTRKGTHTGFDKRNRESNCQYQSDQTQELGYRRDNEKGFRWRFLEILKHELNSAEYKFYLVDFGYFSYRVSNISTLLQAFLKRKV